MTESGEVRYGDALIRYRVVRSPRRHKTIEVTVDEPGLATVSAPGSTPVERLEATVRRRAGWIVRHNGAAALAPAARRFVSGESLPYLGRHVRLTVHPTDDDGVAIRFHHWQFEIDPSGTRTSKQQHGSWPSRLKAARAHIENLLRFGDQPRR